jgi:predicted NBD/HSP70 family sugar kinase
MRRGRRRAAASSSAGGPAPTNDGVAPGRRISVARRCDERAIARETGRYGITSNAIALSALEDLINRDRAKATLSRYVIRRYGKPTDVAANWITGQTCPVNGGYQFAQSGHNRRCKTAAAAQFRAEDQGDVFPYDR